MEKMQASQGERNKRFESLLLSTCRRNRWKQGASTTGLGGRGGGTHRVRGLGLEALCAKVCNLVRAARAL